LAPNATKGVFIATQLNSTQQLNSTDPIEQRTARSVVFLFMTSRPIYKLSQLLFTLSSWVQLSCVAIG